MTNNEFLQNQINELSKQVRCLFERLNALQPGPEPTAAQSMDAALNELNHMLQEEKVNNVELTLFKNEDPARPFLFTIKASFLRFEDDIVPVDGDIMFRFKEWPNFHKLCEIKDTIKDLATTVAKAQMKNLL